MRRPPSLKKVAGPVAQLILPENAKKSLVVRGKKSDLRYFNNPIRGSLLWRWMWEPK